MIYNLIIKEQAKLDFDNIAIYYNSQRKDLGFEFWDAIEIALHDITSNPLGYQIKHDVYRTKLTKPFPYLLIFELTLLYFYYISPPCQFCIAYSFTD